MRSPVYFFIASVFLSVALSTTFSGCSSKTLPSTNVPPTRDNKRIVAFLEQYKAALEKRSVDAILELVARDFSDNMGSEDPALRLDYLALKERLDAIMPLVSDSRVGLYVQHIAKLDKERWEVVFHFNKQHLVQVLSEEKWMTKQEVNRMVIRKRSDRNPNYEFEILQGI